MSQPKANDTKYTLNGTPIGVDEKGKVIPDNKAIQVETGNKDMAIQAEDNIILENGQRIGENGEVLIMLNPQATKALFKKRKAEVKQTKNGKATLENGAAIVIEETKTSAKKANKAVQGRE